MKKYILFILISLTLPIITNANGDEGCFHMMDWYSFGGWSMFVYPLFWIILIGGFVALIVRNFVRSNIRPPQEKTKSALEILKEQYVKGEIDKKEFEEKKKDIGE